MIMKDKTKPVSLNPSHLLLVERQRNLQQWKCNVVKRTHNIPEGNSIARNVQPQSLIKKTTKKQTTYCDIPHDGYSKIGVFK